MNWIEIVGAFSSTATAFGVFFAWWQIKSSRLQHEITAPELLAQAGDGDKKTEAQAYIGVDLSLAGKRDEALVYLQWVKDNGNKNFVEYSLALSEIDRIKATKESNRP